MSGVPVAMPLVSASGQIHEFFKKAK